jgi:hypothetical protein
LSWSIKSREKEQRVDFGKRLALAAGVRVVKIRGRERRQFGEPLEDLSLHNSLLKIDETSSDSSTEPAQRSDTGYSIK